MTSTRTRKVVHQEEFRKLPPGEREKAVRDYWSKLTESLSPSERAAMSQMANLPPEQQERFKKLPPGEREKAVQDWWRNWALQHMGPHGVEMPTPEGRQIQESVWQAVSSMGPSSVAGAEPLAFLRLLRSDEAFADIYKYKIREGDHFGAEHYLVVMSANGTPSRLIQLGAAEPIDAAINSFYSKGSEPAAKVPRDPLSFERGAVKPRQDHTKEWKALQNLVLTPILSSLPSGTTKIILSPDSSLAVVPFASLALDMGVLDPITIIPSVYDLVRLRGAPALVATRRAVIIGDLDYGEGKGSLAPLPGTKDEIAGVAALATRAGFQTTTLSGLDATHVAIIEKIRDATMLHLATHGAWSKPESDGVAEAFDAAQVALSQANSGTPESMLTAAEILRLNLSSVQLITLSACSSGQGRPVDGQGLLGFQTAFMAAGAHTLLISMWPVPDQATSQLMQSFYKALWTNPSISKAEALRQAQMQLRSNPSFADPQNWAAWVLVGEAW